MERFCHVVGSETYYFDNLEYYESWCALRGLKPVDDAYPEKKQPKKEKPEKEEGGEK